jgi:hypothetical protein
MQMLIVLTGWLFFWFFLLFNTAIAGPKPGWENVEGTAKQRLHMLRCFKFNGPKFLLQVCKFELYNKQLLDPNYKYYVVWDQNVP